MADIWFISDTHFFHDNILKFKDKEGSYFRNFSDVTEMNETIRDRWNSRVKPTDKIYHLGDVTMATHGYFHQFFSSLHGHKRLVVGNHDNVKQIHSHFDKITIWRIFKEYNFTCSHIPLREDSLRTEFNVHGHIHQNKMDSPRYINVCVEHTNYTPVHLDELRKLTGK